MTGTQKVPIEGFVPGALHTILSLMQDTSPEEEAGKRVEVRMALHARVRNEP